MYGNQAYSYRLKKISVTETILTSESIIWKPGLSGEVHSRSVNKHSAFERMYLHIHSKWTGEFCISFIK